MMIHALFDLGIQSMADVLDRENGSWDDLERLRLLIDHAAHLLPAQGPITVFIHHNTLHAFEDLDFDRGVQKGAEIFGCRAYLPEERFRQHLASGRIRVADLQSVVSEDLGTRANEPVLHLGTRFDLRMAMLQFPKWTAPQAELHWFVAQTDALTKFRKEISAAARERLVIETRHWVMRDLRQDEGNRRPAPPRESLAALLASFGEERLELWDDATWERFSLQALWRVIRDAVEELPPAPPIRHRAVRPRDWILTETGKDCDLRVNEILIRFCAAFLDQGIAQWPLPRREEGFLASFAALYGRSGGPPSRWLRDLPRELRRIREAGLSPLESIRESLELMGVAPDDWDDAIVGSFLSLRGWAGMIRQMELRADRVARPVPPGTLKEYLAIRLILERLSAATAARDDLGYRGPLRELRDALPARDFEFEERSTGDQRAFQVFQLAQLLGWAPGELNLLTRDEWARLVEEIEGFTGLEQCRIFQRAFERRYRNQILDALLARSPRPAPTTTPRFQIVCCLDEREESFRRHVEELEPEAATFGVAGFFAVPMYFRGAADAHFVPLCPVVLRPKHWVEESVAFSHEESHRLRARVRKALGEAAHLFHLGTRTGAGGAILSTALGALATIPLVARVLLPRFTSRVRSTAQRLVQAPTLTQLQIERVKSEPGPERGQLGFSVDEMTNMAERLLRDIGLVRNFSGIVLLIGHGSNSVNNPHKSAYDCGACGGNAGGANARAAAQILNDPRIRERLAARGLVVPAQTHFVGGFHNTCNDSVAYFDLERLPLHRADEFSAARRVVELACDRNAHERSRRFQSAPLTLPFAAARRHVEARAEDLAQTRPECGHATNAICFVGRRERTRGLYLDRRAFLASYDPTQDDAAASILTRTLQAAVPVCGGINLEYYFSYVDPVGWGCGTKLPHNVTSLLGVMDGAASDLRPGLPWQMVEIHEPVRLLFIVETTADTIVRIMKEHDGIGKLIRNNWVQMAVLNPDSSDIEVFRDGRFVPYDPENTQLPKVASSVDWYRGWRDHLGVAVVRD